MRVISGSVRGRKLKEPAGVSVRPTSDMVKESVFNIIQFDIEGRKVLDMFAGTGQLGLEALSRGAGSAVFVDSKSDSVKLIWENVKICGFEDRVQVLLRDALRYAEGDEKFDLIFLDPPYGDGVLEKILTKITEVDKLNTNGIIICEMDAQSASPEVLPPYALMKEYRYGRVKIVRYERN